MLNFKLPSQNSPFVPGILLGLHWALNKAFLVYGPRYLNSAQIETASSVIKGAFIVIGLFSIVIILSYLATQKMQEMMIAVAIAVVVTMGLAKADDIIEPRLLKIAQSQKAGHKSYSLYRYLGQNLLDCNEYKEISDLDFKNAKSTCEKDRVYSCVAQDNGNCSPAKAHTLCEKMKHKRVLYSATGSTEGFDSEQCRLAPR